MWDTIRNERKLYREGRAFIREVWNSIPYETRKGLVFIPRKAGKHMVAGMAHGRVWVSRGYCKAMAICRTVEKMTQAQPEDMHLAENVFRHTVGHEISHADDRYKRKILLSLSKKRSFFSKVDVVHADFNGAALLSLPVEEVVKTMKFRRGVDGNEHTPSHPSWGQRIRYISTGKYDAGLVRVIADDMNFTDGDAIAEAEQFYPDIALEKSGTSDIELEENGISGIAPEEDGTSGIELEESGLSFIVLEEDRTSPT